MFLALLTAMAISLPNISAVNTEPTIALVSEEKTDRIDFFDSYIDTLEDWQQELFTDEFIEALVTECEENDIDVWFVLAVAEAESAYDANAKAYDGSAHWGLFQLSEKYFECEDYFDPIENMTVACKSLANYAKTTKNYRCVKNSGITLADARLLFVADCHNRGLGGALEAWQDEEFSEQEVTDYCKKILAHYKYNKKKYGEYVNEA